MSLPKTQTAIALPAPRTPFINLSVPVYPPQTGEVTIKTLWTSSTPLDLHRADGGLLIPSYPFLMGGGGAAGVVVAVGDGSNDQQLKGLRVGDRVTTFAFRGDKEANHQEYLTVPSFLVSKVPDNLSLEEAVTVPVNLVTVLHSATHDLNLELPWPIPQNGWKPKNAQDAILIWGAASSVGLFAVQVLRHWGYENIIAVASEKHHENLRGLGAKNTFDYRDSNVTEKILKHLEGRQTPSVPFILDCIGSLDGTLRPLTKIAQAGSRVAVMLPVIIKDATESEKPEYEMDVTKVLVGEWSEGVILRNVRTHLYPENEFLKEKAQPDIIPALLEQCAVKPNRFRIVEGATALERAQNALNILRRREVSGERLIWRISKDDKE